jgi:hypothetical protein
MSDYQMLVSDGTGSGSTSIYMNPPLIVTVGFPIQKFAPTVNGGYVACDVPTTYPTTLNIECTNVAITGTGLDTFWGWYVNRTLLTITDQSSDAYFQTYSCYISEMPGNVMSPYKSKPENFVISFVVSSVTIKSFST